MVNIKSCDGCVHSKVCGKKDIYHDYAEKVEDICVGFPDNGIMMASDCKDITITLECEHFQSNNYTGVR